MLLFGWIFFLRSWASFVLSYLCCIALSFCFFVSSSFYSTWSEHSRDNEDVGWDSVKDKRDFDYLFFRAVNFNSQTLSLKQCIDIIIEIIDVIRDTISTRLINLRLLVFATTIETVLDDRSIVFYQLLLLKFILVPQEVSFLQSWNRTVKDLKRPLRLRV